MHDAIVSVPTPVNETVLGYVPGSPERAALKAALKTVESEVVEIPCVVGGERVFTGKIREVRMPHAHRHVIARFHAAIAPDGEGGLRGYCHPMPIVIDRFGPKEEMVWYPYTADKEKTLQKVIRWVWGTPLGRMFS